MPSASRPSVRLGVLAACALLLSGSVAGCSTTQEKAEAQQAQSKQILKARAARQQKADGPKSGRIGPKSAHRQQEDGDE